MSKYLNRLACRMARAKLAESKSWIATKSLILETEEGDVEIQPGEELNLGASEDGDLAIDAPGKAAVVVISDPELAKEIADTVVNADELSDVEFVDKPALDALNDEEMDVVVDKLADGEDEDETVEVGQVSVDQKESVSTKFAKFAENKIHGREVVCEAIQVAEEEAPIDMLSIKCDRVKKESVEDYAKFTSRVAEMHGSIQPGEREIALTESGKVFGSFDKAANHGKLYLESEFDDAAAMDAANDEPVSLVDAAPLGDADEAATECVECALKGYEESAKTGADYMKMVEALEGAKLAESTIASIVATFDSKSLKESCCRVYDSKYGRNVACFKEGVEADNFMADTKAEKRFSKRYFA